MIWLNLEKKFYAHFDFPEEISAIWLAKNISHTLTGNQIPLINEDCRFLCSKRWGLSLSWLHSFRPPCICLVASCEQLNWRGVIYINLCALFCVWHILYMRGFCRRAFAIARWNCQILTTHAEKKVQFISIKEKRPAIFIPMAGKQNSFIPMHAPCLYWDRSKCFNFYTQLQFCPALTCHVR